MVTSMLVTFKEFVALDRELSDAMAGKEAKESRIVRARSMVHDFVGYRPPAESANVRMSFLMYPRVYHSRQASATNASRFSYGNLGALGSLTVQLMMEGRSESASSFMMTMKGEWPELYSKVVEYEFHGPPSGAPVKDNKIYGRIHDVVMNLNSHGLATYVPPTSLIGSQYRFSRSDRAKIVTL
ncbi:MAG: hypothetical protein NT016_03745 [Candidatus Aenigmarchaeota archaeon]|nr:hypothetical protein [Candidatus Aenigmarchaeota archaeon]